jgi:hypothetical protein
MILKSFRFFLSLALLAPYINPMKSSGWRRPSNISFLTLFLTIQFN